MFSQSHILSDDRSAELPHRLKGQLGDTVRAMPTASGTAEKAPAQRQETWEGIGPWN